MNEKWVFNSFQVTPMTIHFHCSSRSSKLFGLRVEKKKFWQKFEKLIFYLLSFGKAFLWKQFKNLLTGVETHQTFQSFIILRWKFLIIKAINLKSFIIVQKRERALELASCYFKDKKVRNTFLQISN